MGGRKKHRKHHDPANVPPRASNGGALPDPPSRLFALQQDVIAVAFGTALRAYDMRTGKLTTLSGPGATTDGHAATIRALAFDPAGRHLLAGDDAKLCKVWDLHTGQCVQSMSLQKKVSAVAASADGKWVLAADKFGDVYVASLLAHERADTSSAAGASNGGADPVAAAPDAGGTTGQHCSGTPGDGKATASLQAAPSVGEKATLLLGHYNATITSLTMSADGGSLVSTDRDGKARVSVFPRDPLQGANEIRSYCLGHRQFVSCSAFISQGEVLLLATGSGDGSVRLWQHLTGRLAETAQLSQQSQPEAAPADAPCESSVRPAATEAAGNVIGAEAPCTDVSVNEPEIQEEGEDGDNGADVDASAQDRGFGTHPAVLAIAVSPSGRTIAAAVEGEDDLYVLHAALRRGRHCGLPKGVLSVAQRLTLPGLHQPFAVAFQPDGRLWAAGVGADADTADRCIILRAADRSSSPEADADHAEVYVIFSSEPLSAEARAALEGCGADDADGGATNQISAHLKRKMYTGAHRTEMKRLHVNATQSAPALAATDGIVILGNNNQ